LNYKGWENNEIEKFYLKPLKKCMTRLKLRLSKLFSQGIDFWKLPLSHNEEFLEDVNEMIKAELIADNLMEDLQKKDQLNFVYDTLKIIMDSPAKEKLLAREDSIMKTTIPYLIIFKTIQRMRSILDRKQNDIDEEKKFEKYNE